MRQDPTDCWYEKSCPFDTLSKHPEAALLYRFCTGCLERSDIPEEGGGFTKALYTVNPEKFRLQCDMYWIRDGFDQYYSPRVPILRDMLHAYEFATWFAEVLGQAPNARKRRSKPHSGGAGGPGATWSKVV